MKTVTLNLYSFDELNEEAKEVAKENTECSDFWADDSYNSYKAAKELYQLFDIENEIHGERLYSFIQNNIFPQLTARKLYAKNMQYYTPKKNIEKSQRLSKIFKEIDPMNLTGYCDDCMFLAPIFDFMEKPDTSTTNTHFLNINLKSIADKIAQNERDSFYEDDNFCEFCEENNILFTIMGKKYENN